jgi:hypothetical protein
MSNARAHLLVGASVSVPTLTLIAAGLVMLTAACSGPTDDSGSSSEPCTADSPPTKSAPADGLWGSTSSGFWFRVASGGGSIAAPSGAASMGIALSMQSTDCPPPADYCTQSVSRYVYDAIPIEGGRFTWSDDEFDVAGVFCGAKSAAGTITHKGATLTWEKAPAS